MTEELASAVEGGAGGGSLLPWTSTDKDAIMMMQDDVSGTSFFPVYSIFGR